MQNYHTAKAPPVVVPLLAEMVKEFNASQLRAVEYALSRTVALIEGPPGTGKTLVLATIVRCLQRGRPHDFTGAKWKLFLCADSHGAIDNIMMALPELGLKRRDMLRICRREKLTDKKMEPYLLGAKRERKGQIDEAMVIGSTMMNCGHSGMERLAARVCIIDEAAQATEPTVLVPAVKDCEQLVLCGDRRQLPPTVASDLADENGYAVSLLERLINNGIDSVQLDTQYRMHPSISSYPSSAFYDGSLKDGAKLLDRRPTRIFGFSWPGEGEADKPSQAICFFDVDGREEKEPWWGESLINKAEAEAIAAFVRRHGLSTDKKRLGIATTYSKQVELIRSLLPEYKLCIGSVDSLQGREVELLCLSTVRANYFDSLGHVADLRRANVALTRARNGLLIFGSRRTLETDGRLWAPFLEGLVEKGAVRDLPLAATSDEPT